MIRRALGIVLAVAIIAPAGAQPRSEPLNAFLQRHFATARTGAPDTRYAIAWIDLNGDPRRDLAVAVSGGGIQPGYQARLTLDGRSYADNPTVDGVPRMRRGERGQLAIVEGSVTEPLF